MDGKIMKGGSTENGSEYEYEMGIRKGPWTVEEDTILANYIDTHGEGRWNSMALCAGLKRTGKSCRLRWLNYLRPDVRRGNITLQEQILILDLHSRWGNRWSKIAQQLPGRTDNEIKNYWRTRVITQAKQLKCDVNSKQFRDTMRYVWMPRLMERIRVSPEYHPIHQACSSTTSELQVTSNSDLSESSGDPIGNGSTTQMLGVGNIQSGGGDCASLENLWNDENMWFLRQQLCDNI